MESQAIDLSAGMIPDQPQGAAPQGGIDLSAGMVPDSGSPNISAGLVPNNPPAPVNPHAITQPVAQISAYNPSFGETLRATIRNGPIGRSLTPAMPGVMHALGLDPTQTEAEQQRTAGQSDELINLRPLIENARLPDVPVLRDIARSDSTQPKPIAQRFGTGVAGVASGMTTPGNAAIMAATGGLGEFAAGTPVVGRLISAGFSAQMLKGLYDQYPQFKAAVDRKDYGSAAEIAGQMAGTAGMAYLSGKHALTGGKTAVNTDTDSGGGSPPSSPPLPAPFTPQTGAEYVQQVRAGVHPAQAAADLNMNPQQQELTHVANFIDPAMADKVLPPTQPAPPPPQAPSVAPQAPPVPPSAPEVQANAQMTEVTRLAAAAQQTLVQAEQLTGMRPPPPPKPQVPLPDGLNRGELTRQTVDNAGQVIQTAPPEQQGQLKVAAVGSFAKWIAGQKSFVDPDGKIINVDGDTPDAVNQSARKIATKVVNDEVDRQTEAAQAKADAAQQEAEEQAKQQEEDQKTAEEERVAARQDAQAGKAPPLAPDIPQYNAVRQALDRTDVNTPAEKLGEVVRRAAAAAKLPMTPEMRDAMVQEHLGRRQQQETSAVQGEPVKPGQSPAELNAWHEDVKNGTEPFMHVAEDTNFKPKDRKGLTTTRVTDAGDANGTYYHAKDIKPTDIKEAARTGKLDQLAEDWKAKQSGTEGEPNGKAEERSTGTEGMAAVHPESHQDGGDTHRHGSSNSGAAEETGRVDSQATGLGDDRGEGERQDQLRASHPDVEAYRKALAEGKSPEEASDAVAAAQGGEPETEESGVNSVESGTLAPQSTESNLKSSENGGRGESPEPTEGGEAAPAVETKYKFGSTQANIPETSPAHKAIGKMQKSIADEDLAGDGKDIDKPHVTVRYGLKSGLTPELRAWIESQAPFEAKLGPTTSFPPSENSDGAAPIIAPVESPELHRLNAEIEKQGDFEPSSFPDYKPHVTVAFVKPELAEKYAGLSEAAGKTFPIKSIAISDQNGEHTEVALKGTNRPKLTPEAAAGLQMPEKTASFKPGDKVQVKNADGTTRDGVLRFKNPNGKWVLKGERKAVPEGDISNGRDGGKPIAANDQQGTEGGTGEQSGQDSSLQSQGFDRSHPEAGFLDLSDLANAVEPLREALEKRVDVADVAGTVHDTLQNLDRTNKATTLQMKDTVRAMADPKFSHEDGEQVFKNLEDPSVPLSPNQIELRDKYVKPLNAATRADYITTQLIKSGKFSLDDILAGKVPPEEVAKFVPDQENYQHRVAVGKDTLVERLIGETAKKFGALGGKLARTFSSEKTRTLREIHGPDGEREAVAVKGDRVIQFVNKDNSGVLDDKIAAVKDQLAKEKASKSPDEERIDNLQRQIDGLNEQKQTVADGGHTTVDMGPHKAGFVTTKDLADEAAAPLEKKLAEMENEFHLLHGSQARVRASTNRISNLYDKIDETEKQIAAIRASIGPEEQAKTGLTDDELLGQQKTDIEALQKRVEKFETRQAKLQATEGRSPAQERELKNIPGRIEETNDQIAGIKDSAISQGLEGKYWRDKNGGLWKFDQGTADFISQRTGQEYFTDARMAALANHLEVNKAMNAAVALEHTKALLEDRGMGIKVENKANAPTDWKPTTLPQFRDYYFPEHIADALDQFHYKQLGGQDVLQQVNGFLMQTILMNPLMHIPNVAMNALVGKGAEFFSGKGLDPSWYADNVKAGLKAVNVLKDLGGKEYQHLLRVGLDLRGSDSSFDATTKDIMRQWTDQLKDNPEHNAAMSALLKVKDAAQFLQKIQHQVTFGANDAFTLQSFYAKRAELIRKGMDTDTAEAAARDYVHLKGVGEYTTPVQLARSSTLGRLADNPLVNAFWHYHYGYLIKPLVTAIGDAVGPDDLRFKADEDASTQTGKTVNKMGETANQQRAVAVARLAFLTLFATTIKPLLDKAAKELTGNPLAESPDGGQTALVSSAVGAYKDEHNVGKGILSAATSTAGRLFIPSPTARNAVGLIGNYDTFLGRHVRNPNDDVSEQAKQVGTWLTKGTYPAQLQVGSGGGGWQKPLEKFVGVKFPLHDGIKAATEIRSDERGKLPSDPVKTRTFQAIMAAAEQSHRSGGQDTSLADALYESGQLSKGQEKELGKAIQDSPIVFAVGGLQDADVYHVFQRSSEQERADLLSDDKVYAKMDKYQQSLRDAGDTAKADKILADINPK